MPKMKEIDFSQVEFFSQYWRKQIFLAAKQAGYDLKKVDIKTKWSMGCKIVTVTLGLEYDELGNKCFDEKFEFIDGVCVDLDETGEDEQDPDDATS